MSGEEAEEDEEETDPRLEFSPDHQCPISLKFESRTNVYLVFFGYMQGLYPSEYYPKTGCKRCEDTALPMSQLIHAMAAVLDLFESVLGENSMDGMSQFEQLMFLQDSFIAFWEFGINFDQILQSVSSIIMYRQFLNLVDDEIAGFIGYNIQTNLSAILTLVSSLDFENNDCRHSGVVLGALLRNLMGFRFVN